MMTMTRAESERNQANKERVWKLWADLAIAPAAEVAEVLSTAMSPEVIWNGFAPIGTVTGIEELAATWWTPFQRSFRDVRRETHLFFGGQSNGRADGDASKDGRWWVTGTGYFHGVFERDYLGIAATGAQVSVRWGEFCCFEDGVITEIYFLIDLIDLMQQAGIEVLPAARGANGIYPPPAAADGVLREAQNFGESSHSLDHIRAFIFDGLNAFDESDLSSMGMADWFHPDVQWYGPGGIGACRSFKEFEDLHQAPWLVAFPDRQVQDLDALFAEDVYSGAPGWAGVVATHTGPYLDAEATGKRIEFNGLDWWKRDGDTYIENWVFVDMVHLFDQFGFDLMGRARR